MRKIVIIFVALFLISGYTYANYLSPSSEDINIEVVAIAGGIQVEGNKAVKVFFSYNLDKKPVFYKESYINVEWDEDWRLHSHNLKKNGKYSEDKYIPSYNKNEIELTINPAINFDEKGYGEGYVILIPKNKKALMTKNLSSANVEYIYISYLTELKKVNSTAWENAHIR